MIWTHGEETLNLCHEKLNQADPKFIKLILAYYQNQVHFLDITITTKDSNISTLLHQKPTHSYSYTAISADPPQELSPTPHI